MNFISGNIIILILAVISLRVCTGQVQWYRNGDLALDVDAAPQAPSEQGTGTDDDDDDEGDLPESLKGVLGGFSVKEEAEEGTDETETPPAETQAPPAKTEAPPAKTEAPPAETQAPPAETQAPPAETQAPPAKTEAPPAKTEAPPAETQAPPAETQAPPAETKAPAAETQAPPAETKAPAAETKAPAAETKAPPEVRKKGASATTEVPAAATPAPPKATEAPAAKNEFLCTFEEGDHSAKSCGMKQRDDDQFDWIPGTGETPSGDTGPFGAHGGKWYLFIETSDRKKGDAARVELPAVKSKAKYCISFWYNMFGYDINRMAVYADMPGKMARIYSKIGNQGMKWYRLHLKGTLPKGSKIVIEGVSGTRAGGDIGIDDVRIKEC